MPANNEIIQIHVGQAGVQMANACWELYCIEHGININGQIKYPDCTWNTFFGVASGGKVVPRVVMVDLDSLAIDEIRTGFYRNLFHPSTLISGKEDASNNFARGFNVLGPELIDLTMDQIRRVAETCGSLEGFILFRSIGGGTGGGLGSLILEKLNSDYGKKTKFEFEIFPSPTISPVIVEPYNAILASHTSMDLTDCSFLVDNEAIYTICSTRLDITAPNYTNLNRLIAQVLSSITASMRFEGQANVTFNDLKTNLVPFPRIHFPMLTYAPMISAKKAFFQKLTAKQITDECFEAANQMVKCNPEHGKYIGCVLLYRGQLSQNEINTSITNLKRTKLNFVDWVPTNFKFGINNRLPQFVPGSDLGPTNKSVCMAANNTSVRAAWCRIVKKFNKMFFKRAFFHHYIGAGLEEITFNEAKENLCTLIDDYMLLESESVRASVTQSVGDY